jgi:hypothetical protein
VEGDYAKPRWQGSPLGTPFFVGYGKKGGEVRQEQSEKYVYAVSTDDFWKNGESLFLLRVLRRALPQLNAIRWEARMRTVLGALG